MGQAAITKLSTSRKSYGIAVVPREVSVAEFESAVRLLVVQLSVLKQGGSILETERVYEQSELKTLRIMSKLAYMLTNKDDESALPFNHVTGSNMLRGKCGLELQI